MEDKNGFIDELLDASLRRYASDEPRAGLENRILANVRAADHAARRRSVWVWAIAASAAALVIVAVESYISYYQPVPVRAPAPVATTNPGPIPTPQINVASQTETAKPGAAAKRTLAQRHGVTERNQQDLALARRPEQFPTPAPLSEQEKLLLAYVALSSKSDLSTPVVHDPVIEPLQIPEIKIARIEIKELPKLSE